MKKENLILGIVKGYQFLQIQPFLVSLKKAEYSGDICLFVCLDEVNRRFLQDFGYREFRRQDGSCQLILRPFTVIPGIKIPFKIKDKTDQRSSYAELNFLNLINFYPFNKLHSLMINISTELVAALKKEDRHLIKANLLKRYLHIVSIRFFHYYTFLYENREKYSKILMTDVRDVLFQQDPFNFEFPDGLLCFAEDSEIRDCIYNSGWIVRAIGTQSIDEIGNKRALCCGTTMGTTETVLIYLKLMIDYILKAHYQTFGVDQAIHNYILHKDFIKDLTMYENYSSPILTMNWRDEENIKFNEQGLIVNRDGSIVNTLHKYDRCSESLRNKMAVYNQSRD